ADKSLPIHIPADRGLHSRFATLRKDKATPAGSGRGRVFPVGFATGAGAGGPLRHDGSDTIRQGRAGMRPGCGKWGRKESGMTAMTDSAPAAEEAGGRRGRGDRGGGAAARRAARSGGGPGGQLTYIRRKVPLYEVL